MGPRSFERGKAAGGRAGDPGPVASMGPRSFERGKAGLLVRPRLGAVASMGPRSFERGKIRAGASPHCGLCRLQWGRVRLNAESEGLTLGE